MNHYLLDGRTVARFHLQHSAQQVNELFRSKAVDFHKTAYYLVVILKRDVSENHVIEEDTEGPHSGRPAVVPVL